MAELEAACSSRVNAGARSRRLSAAGRIRLEQLTTPGVRERDWPGCHHARRRADPLRRRQSRRSVLGCPRRRSAFGVATCFLPEAYPRPATCGTTASMSTHTTCRTRSLLWARAGQARSTLGSSCKPCLRAVNRARHRRPCHLPCLARFRWTVPKRPNRPRPTWHLPGCRYNNFICHRFACLV